MQLCLGPFQTDFKTTTAAAGFFYRLAVGADTFYYSKNEFVTIKFMIFYIQQFIGGIEFRLNIQIVRR